MTEPAYTENCCKRVARVSGTYHSRWCDKYPNVKLGAEKAADRSVDYNVRRSELHKAAIRTEDDYELEHSDDDDDNGDELVPV